MALPPLPEGLRDATAEDFQPRPARVERWRIVAAAVVAVVGSHLALRRWGGDLVSTTAAVAATVGWLAAVIAQFACLRRDVPVGLTIAECRVDETERGALAWWRFAPPVPARLAAAEIEADWARAAEPGDRVAVRVQETGFGTVTWTLGAPQADRWRLPDPRPRWPVMAQLYAAYAGVALLAVVVLAAAPSRVVTGEITACEQEPWQTGDGRLPWQLTIVWRDAAGEAREVMAVLRHDAFLALLPARGQKALATPGLLPPDERSEVLARYLPVQQTVRLRETWLGPLRSVSYVGPGTEP